MRRVWLALLIVLGSATFAANAIETIGGFVPPPLGLIIGGSEALGVWIARSTLISRPSRVTPSEATQMTRQATLCVVGPLVLLVVYIGVGMAVAVKP